MGKILEIYDEETDKETIKIINSWQDEKTMTDAEYKRRVIRYLMQISNFTMITAIMIIAIFLTTCSMGG